jgi:predicted ATP-dependent serine protease
VIPLSTALAQTSEAGEPLPAVWQEFVEHQVEFRQGQLAVIAAGPGGGKSVLAVNLVVRTGEPALYISADTDSFTTGLRVGALMSGDPLPKVEAAMKSGRGEKYQRMIGSLEHVRWAFESSPTVDDIRDDIEAFAHVYGCYPKLVVVDNLMNIYSDEEDNTALRHSVESLNIMARESGACVVVLHHITGQYESGDIPPSLGALLGKVGKMPSLVLTMFRGNYGDLGICIVKNRFGPADPRGHLRMYLNADLERVRVG